MQKIYKCAQQKPVSDEMQKVCSYFKHLRDRYSRSTEEKMILPLKNTPFFQNTEYILSILFLLLTHSLYSIFNNLHLTNFQTR